MSTRIIYERTEQGGKIGFQISDISATPHTMACPYTSISETSDDQLIKLRDKLIEDFPPEEDDKPNKFAEPTEIGFYITQSGIILYNDGQERMPWGRLGRDGDDYTWNPWQDIVESFDRSEFPLVHFTREQLAALAKGE